MRTVEQARHDVGVAGRFRGAVTIGARFGLWEQFLLTLLPDLLRDAPEISVRAEIGLEMELMQGLIEGRVDIGVMYTPESRPGLKVEHLFDERLVLASTDRRGKAEPGPGYIYVDWGPEFFAKHSASFPEFPGSRARSGRRRRCARIRPRRLCIATQGHRACPASPTSCHDRRHALAVIACARTAS